MANRCRSPPANRDQQHAGGFHTQQPAPASAAEAMAAPVTWQTGLVAAPASPSQEHSTQSARRSPEETRRPPHEQHVGAHDFVESLHWWGEAEAEAGPAALRTVPRMPAPNGAHIPDWRDVLGDGDTPRAATKRAKNEVADNARRAYAGPGHSPVGEPQSSDDTRSARTDAYETGTTPPAASPLLQGPVAGVRATLSQSSEIGVAPRWPQDAELRAQWTTRDAFSFSSPVSLSTMAV